MSEELKHTPLPWTVDDFTGNIIWDAKKQRVADIRGWGHLQKLGEDEGIKAQTEIADRIVNCINACAGMADPQAEILSLRQEVERLKAFIGADESWMRGIMSIGQELIDLEERAENAEAKITQLLADQAAILKSHTEEQDRADKAEAIVAGLKIELHCRNIEIDVYRRSCHALDAEVARLREILEKVAQGSQLCRDFPGWSISEELCDLIRNALANRSGEAKP